jgi:hypothetical protein
MTIPSRQATDPRFKYVPAAKTDIRRTFRKARLYFYLKGKQA